MPAWRRLARARRLRGNRAPTLADARSRRAGSRSARCKPRLGPLAPPLRDDARAAELLEPIADPASAGVGRFAALLALQIGERAKLGRELDRVQREHERSDRERDKREEALRQQLEALRAIERGIQE